MQLLLPRPWTAVCEVVVKLDVIRVSTVAIASGAVMSRSAASTTKISLFKTSSCSAISSWVNVLFPVSSSANDTAIRSEVFLNPIINSHEQEVNNVFSRNFSSTTTTTTTNIIV